MLPTTKTPPKEDIANLSMLVYGRPKSGKCLSGATQIINPANGRPATLREMVDAAAGEVLTMRADGQLAPATPSAYLENPPAQLYRLTTQTGRSIEATAQHPFWTHDGWKPLEELLPGDRVAVITDHRSIRGTCNTSDGLIMILAYLLADGSIGGTSMMFTKNDPVVREDFERAVEACGDECVEFVSVKGVTQLRIRGRRGNRNNVIGFLREVGIHGLRSAEKFIPDFVYSMQPGQLALFMNRLFSCDGSVEAVGKVSFSSTSHRMVAQAQHLLTRFGIASLIHPKYLDGTLYGSELYIAAKDDVLLFLDTIGFIGEKAVRAEGVRASLYNVRASHTQIERRGHLIFDRIRSIEPTSLEPVYDLTIDGTHNFIANDFVVHNSSFCAQADGALFLATEAGLNHLETFQVPIASWDDLLTACADIAKGDHSFRTVVIDTVDNAYRLCVEHVCRQLGITHESEAPYGRAYGQITNEFTRVLTKLSLLPYGLYLVSHAQHETVETRTGTITRMVPTLPDKARKIVLGLVDLILYLDLEPYHDAQGETQYRRVIRTKPSTTYEAGDRTGRLPETLPLDYQAFLTAFTADPFCDQ